MDNNKTEIVVVMDRSGSMAGIARDMEGGLVEFCKKQAAMPGECRVSLFQFDTDYEPVFEGKLAAEVTSVTLEARGGTALNDAVGLTISAVGSRLKALPEERRPGAVIFMVITDGHENSSKEYATPMVRQMVEHQEKAYNWKFVYLGAERSSHTDASNIGVQRSSRRGAGGQGVQAMYSMSSEAVGNYRVASSLGKAAEVDLEIPEDVPEN